MRSNTIKGTPTGVSVSAHAEIRQLLEDFFGEASDAKRLEEDLFEMFQSTLLAMNDMGYDDRMLMRFCWTYRRLSQLMRDLECLASRKSTLTQKSK